VLVYLILINL